jgi:hypothetical protein
MSQALQDVHIWAESDPDSALDFISRASRFPRRNEALAIPLAAIARRNPQQTVTWLHSNLPEQDRGLVAQSVIEQIYQMAPRHALQLAEASDVPVGPYYFGLVFGQLAQTSPQEAVAAFNKLSDQGQYQTAQPLASGWAEMDAASAIAWANSLGKTRTAYEAQTAVIQHLVGTDPAHAFELLRISTLSESHQNMLISQLANTNGPLLIDRLGQLPEQQRNFAIRSLVEDSLDASPDRLASLARSQLPAEEAGRLLSMALGNWLAKDRPAAEAWAAGVQDPALRTYIEQAKLRETAQSDPKLFLDTIDGFPPVASDKQLVESALGQLTPEEAARWIASHPGMIDSDFAGRIASQYFTWDRDQALQWTQQLPAGETQNRAYSGLATSWAENGQDLDRAAEAITAISDPQVQIGARFKVFMTTYWQNPDQASRWLATQPLPPEIRANWQTLAIEMRR